MQIVRRNSDSVCGPPCIIVAHQLSSARHRCCGN